jgi:capsule polysaccharide modification protein KpsS
MISDINKAINSLSDKDIKNLMSDNFTINYPDSFSVNGSVQAPIIVKDQNGYYSRFDAAFTTPNNNYVKKSFSKLNDLLNKNHINVNLKSGDILIFRNQKIVHGRKKFTPKYNGFDRYLIRLFGVDSLDNIVSFSKCQPYHSISV